MLRLSSRGRYAIRAVFDLAWTGALSSDVETPSAPAQVRDVARRQRIPVRFLEQIFQELKRAGIVASKRGPRGGFTLALAPEDVRLGDVLRAVEGPVEIAPPRKRSGAPRAASLRDVADAALLDVGSAVERCFDDVTFGDLCAQGERAGVQAVGRPSARAPLAWVI